MTTTTPSRFHLINGTRARLRQLRMMQIILAGAAAIALLALSDVPRPDTTQPVLASGSVRLIDQAFPQTPPSVIGGSGFAADDSGDQAEQQAAQQEMQQAEQQAEQQEALANQEAQQAEEMGRQVEEQANNP